MPKSKRSPMRFFSKSSTASDWLPHQTRDLSIHLCPRVRHGVRGNGIGSSMYAEGGDSWSSNRRNVWTYDLFTRLTDQLVSGKRLWTVGQLCPSPCGTHANAPDAIDPSFSKMKTMPPSPSGIPVASAKSTSSSLLHCCQNPARRFWLRSPHWNISGLSHRIRRR